MTDLVTPETTRIGWVGAGVMGSSMCARVLAAGYSVTVSTRTKDRAQRLLESGAVWVDTPAEVAARSDVMCTIVGMPADVRAVIAGDDGLLSAAAAGSTIIDMTTSEPELAVDLFELGQSRKVASLDAPVSGGDVGARNGTLSIMVGGEQAAFDRVRPLLETMGGTVVRQGDAGSGQHTKMVNQTVIASTMVGVCEAMVYARSAGLDPTTVLESVSGGAAGSWSLSNLAPRMIAGDDAAGFYVDHFVKDLGIALAEAERMGLMLPGLSLARELYVGLQQDGHGRSGTQALIHVIDERGR